MVENNMSDYCQLIIYIYFNQKLIWVRFQIIPSNPPHNPGYNHSSADCFFLSVQCNSFYTIFSFNTLFTFKYNLILFLIFSADFIPNYFKDFYITCFMKFVDCEFLNLFFFSLRFASKYLYLYSCTKIVYLWYFVNFLVSLTLKSITN